MTLGKKIALGVGIVVLLGLISAGVVANIAYQNMFVARGGSEALVDIPDGSGVKQIGAILEREKMIKSSYAFEWYIYLKKWGSELKAGQYKFDPTKNLAQIAQQLREGGAESQEYQVTIREGLRREDVAKDIAKLGYVTEADMLAATDHLPANLPFASLLSDVPADATAEGFLYPETYRFFKTDTAADIVDRLIAQFDATLDEQTRADIEASGRTLYETMTLASIVQAETSNPENQKKVASVFLNRLEQGMKLESDVTVLYALNKHDPYVTYDDLAVESPYNTYKYAGLIPAPLSSPTIDAIRAVAKPDQTDYLYFVADLKTGKVYFSKTYEEHQAYVDKYLP